MAARKQIKREVSVPRPAHLQRAQAPARKQAAPGEDNVVEMDGYKRAVGVLARSAKHVHRGGA